MKATDISLFDFLSEKGTYIVPVYQREFVWEYSYIERFEKISVNEGEVQSIKNDTRLGDKKDIDRIYVDLTAITGNSGSGVIEKNTGKCIAVYAGSSICRQSGISHTLNFGIHL